MRSKRPKTSWSNLPVEIVRSVAKLLQDDTDYLKNLRLTCKGWRRSTAISSILPLPINSTPRKKLYYSSVSLLRPLGTRSSPSSSYSPWMVSSIEATKGDIQLCHPFSKAPLLTWSLTDGGFNYDRFQSTNLAVAYHLTHASDEERDHREFDKVLLISSESIPSADDCVLLALHDGGKLGGYLSFNNNQDEDDEDELELPWIEVKHGSICRFDDIVMHKGRILVVDRQGKVHAINRNSLEVVNTYVDRPISQARTRAKACRRRFVASSSRKLYLVERTSQRLLKVYKLYEEKSGTMWVEVKTFGDRVMFVTKDYCFFTLASEFSTCNLNNCIVFSNDAFPKYGRTGWELPDPSKSGGDISVFRLEGCSDYNFKSISNFTGFPLLLWSCPPWAWNAGSSSCQCQCQCRSQRETDEDEDQMQIDTNNQDDASPASLEAELEPGEQFAALGKATSVVDVVPSSFESELAEKTTETPSPFVPDLNEVEHVAEKASQPETFGEEISNQSSSIRANLTSTTQSYSTVKFKGFEIKSNLLLTVQTIWSKHKDLIENITIRNVDIVARALESLATVVQILKENSARSLSDSEADQMSSTMSDLECMHFKVDWLTPFVEKAIELHGKKPLMDSVEKLSHCKAQITEKISNLLEELDQLYKMDDDLEEELANMSKLIPSSENVDLDKTLGGGLLS